MTREELINKGEGIVYGFIDATDEEIRKLIIELDPTYADDYPEDNPESHIGMMMTLASMCGVDELDWPEDMWDEILGDDE